MRILARWAASVALLGVTLYLLDWPSLVAAVAKLKLWVFLTAVLLACLPAIPLLVRWHVLTGGAGGWYACSARYLYANLFNAVSPGSLGGDVYRYFALRNQVRSDPMLVAILVRERLLGLASMLIGLVIAVAALQFEPEVPDARVVRVLGLVAAGALAALFVLPRIVGCVAVPEGWRTPLQTALSIGNQGQHALLLTWSLTALMLWLATVQFVAVQLGMQMPWHVLLAVVTVVEFVRIIPVTVQGIGLREGSFATMCGFFGHAHEAAFVVGAIAYLALSVALIVTGALGALMFTRHKTNEPAG